MNSIKIDRSKIFPCVGACMATLPSSNTALVGIVYPADGQLDVRFMPLDSANALLGMLGECVESAIAHRAGCFQTRDVTATRFAANVHWRSVADELPTDDGEVLVSFTMRHKIAVAKYDPFKKYWYHEDGINIYHPKMISHWAVLPASPNSDWAQS